MQLKNIRIAKFRAGGKDYPYAVWFEAENVERSGFEGFQVKSNERPRPELFLAAKTCEQLILKAYGWEFPHISLDSVEFKDGDEGKRIKFTFVAGSPAMGRLFCKLQFPAIQLKEIYKKYKDFDGRMIEEIDADHPLTKLVEAAHNLNLQIQAYAEGKSIQSELDFAQVDDEEQGA